MAMSPADGELTAGIVQVLLAGVYRKRHLGEGEGEEGYTPGRESALFRLGKGPGERPAGLAAFVSPAGQVTARLPDWRAGTLVADLPLGPAFWRRHGGSRIR